MTPIVLGSLLGLLGGGGLLMAIAFSPPLRRRSLADRVAPYVRDITEPSRLIGDSAATSTGTLRRLFTPILRDLVRILDRIVGGQASVRKRLSALGSPTTLDHFRAEQVIWGALGTGAGLGAALILAVGGHRTPILLVGIVLLGAVGGILARDWWLSRAVAEYNSQVLAEFPIVAEMLALAVAAGEGPSDAIARVCRLTRGHLTDRLGQILADTRAGAPLQQALLDARDATALDPLARFLDGMAVAIERGTPMAEVLHAQAADVRALGRRQLLEIGGRKEILMMTPVVFLILPLTILFAFFPGLVAITSVAR